MVSLVVSVLANGVSQSVHIGSEGVPVVTSDVDSESVGNSCDFRMLGKTDPILSRRGVIGGGGIFESYGFFRYRRIPVLWCESKGITLTFP